MNKLCFVCFLILFIINNLTLNAQNKLSLDEAIKLAVENNVSIAKDKNREASTEYDKMKTKLSLLPSLNASGNVFESTGTNFDQLTGMLRTETGQYVNGSITASWDILNIASKVSAINLSKYNNESQKAQLAYTKDFIILNVVGRYLEALQAMKQDQIFNKFCDVQEEQLKRTNELIRVGSLPGQDFYTQNAEWSRLKSLREENLNLMNVKKNQLILLLRLNPANEAQLDTILSKESFKREMDIDSLYKKALEARKDYKKIEAQSMVKKYEVAVQQARYIPSLSLYYDYGSRYSSFQQRRFNNQFFNDNITTTIGVSMQVPIFNGLETRNNVYRAKQDFKNAELDVIQAKNDIYVELKNLMFTISANEKKVIYREDQIESAKRAFELEKERYYLGQGSPLDLGVAQRNYVEASLSLNQINYQLMYNRFELLFYTGDIISLVN
ncbi:TolC family protein [Flavobacterium aestivum]|uniref:TolC family protein n=1 Tax=Flavobacterium aestivum TaxID=3003257 RepID=UPI0024829ED8|nr:TolC family protein [Flavobacterium aestivum]